MTTRVEEAKLEFELSNAEWKLVDRQGGADGSPLMVGFKRSPVQSSSGVPVLSYISVIVENVGPNKGNWVELYTARKGNFPPTKIERMLDFEQGEVGRLNAGGYKGHHTLDGTPHTVFVLFALRGELGIYVVMDATTDVFPELEPEFMASLKSLRHYD